METPPVLNPEPKAPTPKRKGRKKLFFFIGLPVAIALLLVVYLSRHNREPEIPVTTEKVARHTITETVVANGRIYPVLQVHISAEVSGEIVDLLVKEGQFVHKGDLLLKIKPDFYEASLNQAKASFQSSLASKMTSEANLERAEADFKRNKELFEHKLLSEADYLAFKVAHDVALASVRSASNQIEVARATVASAEESLRKTTIFAPIDGTVSKLNSQKGERVLGTVQNAGTDIMVISDLSCMEARVDIGEMDIVLLQPGQKATLEVDSFKDKKFAGVVTDVASSSKDMNTGSGLGSLGGGSSGGQSATQFQVRIRFSDTAEFRPGMSVSATIETRTHTNVLGAPIAAVTTRLLKPKAGGAPSPTNSVAANSGTNTVLTNALAGGETNVAKADKKSGGANKPVEVVFVLDGGKVKAKPVKIGISDDNYWEITDGLKEGDEIVTGGFKAISHDLDDGKRVKISSEASGKM